MNTIIRRPLMNELLAHPDRVYRAPVVMPVDVRADDESFTIEADLPGYSTDDLTINVLENVVSIRAEKAERDEAELQGYLRVERRQGVLARSFRLPSSLDAEKAEASLVDGVLTLRIPKAESAKPKRISINAS